MKIQVYLVRLALGAGLALGCSSEAVTGSSPDAAQDVVTTPPDAGTDTTPSNDQVDGSLSDVPLAIDTNATTDVPTEPTLDGGNDTGTILDAGLSDVSLDGDVDTATDAALDTADAPSDGAVDATTDSGITPQSRSCPSGATERGCGVQLVMGGRFRLGEELSSSKSRNGPEVTVSDFRMDRYEVTVARFRRYWAAGHPEPGEGEMIAYPGGRSLEWNIGVNEPRTDGACTWSSAPGGNEARPIICLTWTTLQAFCIWDGGYLPTKAQWERAATNVAGPPFPWGSASPAGSDAYACWSGGAFRRSGTCNVGGFPEAPTGFYDLAGNVWEFTADFWYRNYDAPCWRRYRSVLGANKLDFDATYS